VSDCHFGIPDYAGSRERENLFVRWLDEIKADAEDIFLLGDIFDFWFEYRSVIPKGYSRVFGKLAELSDAGINIYYFTGNHDMWVRDYFINEFNFKVFNDPVKISLNDKKFLIGHGDGLRPGDYGYKFIKKVFACRFNRFLYSLLHPNIAMTTGSFFSHTSKELKKQSTYPDDKTIKSVFQYIHNKTGDTDFDYYIFGHVHIPMEIKLENSAVYYNTGDWMTHFTYVVFDGKELMLKKYGK